MHEWGERQLGERKYHEDWYGKAVFAKLKSVLSSLSIGIRTRVWIFRCYVWSTLTYGCEAWAVRKDIEKGLKAAEMYF